jgi:hypothetical protein
MTLRGPDKNRNEEAPPPGRGLSGCQPVVARVVIGIVIIATLWITKSPAAVTGVTIPLLIALACGYAAAHSWALASATVRDDQARP